MATPRLITKEAAPWARELSNILPYVQNPDPVLVSMSGRDESLYRDMVRTWPALEVGLSSRRDTLLGGGWKLVPGKGPNAERIHDWTKAAVDGIDALYTTLELSHQALGAGWQPFEMIWEPWTHEGVTYWRVKHIRDQYPECLAFDHQRNIVQIPSVDNGMKHVTWRTGDNPLPLHQLKWWVVRFGSTSIPYGRALLSKAWALWYIQGKWLNMWTSNLQSTNGIICVGTEVGSGGNAVAASQSEGGSSDDGGWTQISRDMQNMIDTLRNDGVLFKKAGKTIEIISDVAASATWKEALAYLDMQALQLTTHQHLATSQENQGARAASETQLKSMRAGACGDGHVIAESFNRGVIDQMYSLNFGEVAPEDRTRLRFNLCHQIDRELLAMMPDNRPDWQAIGEDGKIPQLEEEVIEANRMRAFAESRAMITARNERDEEEEEDEDDVDPDEEQEKT